MFCNTVGCPHLVLWNNIFASFSSFSCQFPKIKCIALPSYPDFFIPFSDIDWSSTNDINDIFNPEDMLSIGKCDFVVVLHIDVI